MAYGIVAANDPVNFIDPTGLFADLGSMSAAMSIRNTLANIQMDFGFGLLSGAQGDDDAIWVNLAFNFMPIIGMVVRSFAQNAKNVLKSGGWLKYHERPVTRYGHTIAKHVGKDETYLLGR